MWLVRTFRNSNSNNSDRQHLEAAASRPRQATDWSQPKPKSATAEREKEWERERERAERADECSFVRRAMFRSDQICRRQCTATKLLHLSALRESRKRAVRESASPRQPQRERERRHSGCRQESEVYSNVLMHMCMLMLALAGFLSRALFSSLCTTLAVSEHIGLLASWTKCSLKLKIT